MKGLKRFAPIAIFLLGISASPSANDEGKSITVDPESTFGIFLSATNNLTIGDESMNGDYFVSPPNPDYGYHATPNNALTFLQMGVDGVHTAILAIDNVVADNSPVVYIDPYDRAKVVAPSFLEYLSLGTGTTSEKVGKLLREALSDPSLLLNLLRDKFDVVHMLGDRHLTQMQESFGHLIDRKSDCDLFDENMRSFFPDISDEDYAAMVRKACGEDDGPAT